MITTALALSLSASAAWADTIKIGVLATLEGPFTVLGEDGVRGVE
ncbi:MAG: ABC transporter substrate-binding protein, partial [Pseudomonadota bacterium]